MTNQPNTDAPAEVKANEYGFCECGLPKAHKRGIRYDDHSPAELRRHFAHQAKEMYANRKKRAGDLAAENERLRALVGEGK